MDVKDLEEWLLRLQAQMDAQGRQINEIDKKLALIVQCVKGNGTKGLAERVDDLEDNMKKLSNRVTRIFLIGVGLGVVALLLTGKVEWIFSRLF